MLIKIVAIIKLFSGWLPGMGTKNNERINPSLKK